MISSFISLYSFRTLFIKTNSSWLITESIKALEIKTSMLFNLDFANNTILLCFFFFFLITDLYFLILAVIAQILNPIAELVICYKNTNQISKSRIETHPVIVEDKIIKCLIWFRVVETFLGFLLINFVLFVQRNKFLFHLYF